MRYDQDPKRAAILRDLLMNYNTQYRPADNAPMPPDGIVDDDAAMQQFYEQWEMNPRSQEFMPEGNYVGPEDGRPDALMHPEAPFDQDMQQYLQQQMPTPDQHMQDVPLGPGGGRQRMLAERLRRG